MRGQAGFDRIAEQLKLTDDQKPKVKAILEDQRKKMGELRQDTSLSQEDRRAKMQTIRENTATQMKAILTPDQFDQWQKINQRQRRPGGPPPNGENAGDANAPATPPKN
jgi:Spy/CpxP family protein refolding chaperone